MQVRQLCEVNLTGLAHQLPQTRTLCGGWSVTLAVSTSCLILMGAEPDEIQ